MESRFTPIQMRPRGVVLGKRLFSSRSPPEVGKRLTDVTKIPSGKRASATRPRREGTSAILISTDGRFLLQLRDNLPDISDPGKLDLFGGAREDNESFLDCVVREVYEEIGFYLAPDKFEFIGRSVGPDHWVPDGTLHNEVFLAREIPIEDLTIAEGSLEVVASDQLEQIQDLLAPPAKRALEMFLKHG
jgi:8-oxo-dGTP diphosphatase